MSLINKETGKTAKEMKHEEQIEVQRKYINRQSNEIDNLKKYITMLDEKNQSYEKSLKSYKRDLEQKVYSHLGQEIEALKCKLENNFKRVKSKYVKIIGICVMYGITMTILFILKVVMKN